MGRGLVGHELGDDGFLLGVPWTSGIGVIMDARVMKLKMLGLPLSDAEKLVKAGLDSPVKIKTAEKLPDGISKAVRERFPKLAL
jgi:hypothetical protein